MLTPPSPILMFSRQTSDEQRLLTKFRRDKSKGNTLNSKKKKKTQEIGKFDERHWFFLDYMAVLFKILDGEFSFFIVLFF